MKKVYYRTRKIYNDVDELGWFYDELVVPSNLKVTEDIVLGYHCGPLTLGAKNETVIEILSEKEV